MKIVPRTFELRTDRLRMVFPKDDEVPWVWDATRYQGFNDGMLWEKPETIEELEGYYPKCIEDWDSGTSYLFTLRTLESNEPVGRISLGSGSCGWTVGFWTHPKNQSAGFMTEGLSAVLAFGFRELGIKKLEACHADWNIASRRVLERNGFRFSRHIEEGFVKNGEWVAEDVMTITLDQWRSHANSSVSQ